MVRQASDWPQLGEGGRAQDRTSEGTVVKYFYSQRNLGYKHVAGSRGRSDATALYSMLDISEPSGVTSL